MIITGRSCRLLPAWCPYNMRIKTLWQSTTHTSHLAADGRTDCTSANPRSPGSARGRTQAPPPVETVEEHAQEAVPLPKAADQAHGTTVILVFVHLMHAVYGTI